MFSNYRALTKIQSVTLIAVIIVAAAGGGIVYVHWTGPAQPGGNIRIGLIADLDMSPGKHAWQGAVLAAEQLNAEGGILGRNVSVVAEDDDSSSGTDISIASNAMTKLITVDQADYVISGGQFLITYQDVCSQHKRILLSVGTTIENYTRRVLDDYDKYKYSFRISPCNESTSFEGMLDDVVTVSNITGFTKVALLSQDFGAYSKLIAATFESFLPKIGIELVYVSIVPPSTTDFTSYLAAVEKTGAEILFPVIGNQAVDSFVKEWANRQSPFILWGAMFPAARSEFWNLTEGKCDTISSAGQPAVAGYPLTNKTIPSRNAYIERWGEVPTDAAVGAYDALRFILSDAIRRAGTTETEAVIKTLETVNVETTSARHFVFTSSHDVMVGSGAVNNPAEDFVVMCYFQWQNGTQVPIKPTGIMKEAGVTFKYPPWEGPWSK